MVGLKRRIETIAPCMLQNSVPATIPDTHSDKRAERWLEFEYVVFYVLRINVISCIP